MIYFPNLNVYTVRHQIWLQNLYVEIAYVVIISLHHHLIFHFLRRVWAPSRIFNITASIKSILDSNSSLNCILIRPCFSLLNRAPDQETKAAADEIVGKSLCWPRSSLIHDYSVSSSPWEAGAEHPIRYLRGRMRKLFCAVTSAERNDEYNSTQYQIHATAGK